MTGSVANTHIDDCANNKQYKKISKGKLADIFYGKESEKMVYEDYLIQFHPEDYEDIYFHENVYNSFDFYVKDNRTGKITHEYELKTRRDLWFKKFDSLFFNESKLKYCDKIHKYDKKREFTILWYLDDYDELYYWTYYGKKQRDQYRRAKGRNDKRGEKWCDCIYVKNEYINKVLDESEDEDNWVSARPPADHTEIIKGEKWDLCSCLGLKKSFYSKCYGCNHK